MGMIAFASFLTLAFGFCLYFFGDAAPWLAIVMAIVSAIANWLTWASFAKEDWADFVAMKDLVGDGIDLEAPRRVQFNLVVPSDIRADAIHRQLLADGYVVETRVEPERVHTATGQSPVDARTRVLQACKVVVLYGDTLRTARKYFTGLASKAGGSYLGWELLDKSPLGQFQSVPQGSVA